MNKKTLINKLYSIIVNETSWKPKCREEFRKLLVDIHTKGRISISRVRKKVLLTTNDHPDGVGMIIEIYDERNYLYVVEFIHGVISGWQIKEHYNIDLEKIIELIDAQAEVKYRKTVIRP